MKYVVFLMLVSMTACHQEERKPLSQKFYVWNQFWHEPVEQAFEKWQKHVDGFHVLAVTVNQAGKVKRININQNHINDQSPHTFVIRINGITLPPVEKIIKEIQFFEKKSLVHRNSRIEIDFDAPTSQLSKYHGWLQSVKSQMKYDLGVTTIPTWLESDDLKNLLNDLDHYVLQVHSVLSPEQGLFDAELAHSWVKQFDQLSTTPFLIALPNYWYQANLDEKGEVLYLSAEQGNFQPTRNSKDIFVDPKSISYFLRNIRHNKWRHVTGLIWFRMPTSQDRRVFSDTTMRHLMNQTKDFNSNRIALVKIAVNPNSSTYDFWLINDADVDVVSSGEWRFFSECNVKHLISHAKQIEAKLHYTKKSVFKSKEKIRIGWGECHEI